MSNIFLTCNINDGILIFTSRIDGDKKNVWSMDRMQAYLTLIKSLTPKLGPQSSR